MYTRDNIFEKILVNTCVYPYTFLIFEGSFPSMDKKEKEYDEKIDCVSICFIVGGFLMLCTGNKGRGSQREWRFEGKHRHGYKC